MRGSRAWHTGLWEGQSSALYLNVLDGPRATRLDEAAIERSPFAVAFLDAFAPRR
jgi:hypothetical protein